MSLRRMFDRMPGPARHDDGCTIPEPPTPLVPVPFWRARGPSICVEAFQAREARPVALTVDVADIVAWRDYYQGENVICPRSRQLLLLDVADCGERLDRYERFLRGPVICVRETAAELLALFDASGEPGAMTFCMFDGAGVYRDPTRMPI